MRYSDNAKLRPVSRERFWTVFLAAALLGTICPPSIQAIGAHTGAVVRAAFGRDCEKFLIDSVSFARKEVLVAIYSITRRSISEAFVQAARRGVAVNLKYDEKSSEWPGMRQAIGYMRRRDVSCTPVRLSGDYPSMHHKFVVIDRRWVLTGSFNFTTTAATASYENIVRIESEPIAQAFAAEFDAISSR